MVKIRKDIDPEARERLRRDLMLFFHSQWCEWISYILKNLGPSNLLNWKKRTESELEEISDSDRQSIRKSVDKLINLLENQ